MKKLNLFSDLWSSVAGSQRNDVEFDRRLTVGSPSGFTINWTLKLVSVLAILLTLGVGNAWADYTITFKDGTGTDAIVASTLSNFISSGTDYVTSASSSYMYPSATTGYGIRLASGNYAGNLTLNLSATGQVKASKITFNACYYGSDASTMPYTITYTDNSTTEGTITTLSSALADKEVSLTSSKTIKTIYIGTTAKKKRVYIHSIKITAGDASTLIDKMYAKGFGSYTTSSYSAAGTDYTAVANSTNATSVTYAMQVFNGSTGQVRGNQSGAANFSCRNTTTKSGYYISSVSLTVSVSGSGTPGLDGSSNSRSLVYFGSSAYANPKTTAPSGTATTASPYSSGQTTLTWSNSDQSVSYFILYDLKAVGTALSATSTTTLNVTWSKKSACAAPTAVGSSSVGNRGATLMVTDANNVNKYDFCCNTSSSATPSATHSVSGGKSKVINDLNYGTKYYYWARTDCGSGSASDWYPSSSPSYFTTTCPTPTSISAGSITSDGATFTITDNNSPKINSFASGGYEIYYSTSSTSPASGTSATTSTTSLSKTVTGLATGTTYYYWVRGYGPDAKSNWVSGGSFAPISVSSIAVKTAPTKTTYCAGEYFDPTGLVITATYSDKSTADVPYAGNSASFTFSPTTSTALIASNTSVTITYSSKSTSQAITVNTLRTISLEGSGNVTGGTFEADNASACVGATITLTPHAASHYSFGSWTVTKAGGGTVTVTSNQFTMPDENVTVSATFNEAAYKTVVFKNNKEKLFDDGGSASTYDATNNWKQKVYVGESPVRPTTLLSTAACDDDSKTFYGWTKTGWPRKIADKSTVDSRTGANAVYTGALPTVTAGDPDEIVFHAVWAEGEDPGDISSTLIAKWDKQSIAASTAIKAKDASGNTLNSVTLTSNIAMTTSAVYGYYNNSISSYPVITISGLDFSDYDGGTIIFFARGSQQASISVEYSTDNGSSYSTDHFSDGTVKHECGYVVSVPNTTTNVKISYGSNTGNFYFGTVRAYGETTTSYDFTELTSSNTSGWSGADWDGYYLITATKDDKTYALRSDVMEGLYGYSEVTPSEGVVVTDDIGSIFKVTYNSSTSKYVIQSVATLDYLTDNGGGLSEKYHLLETSATENEAIAYNEITNATGYYIRWNNGDRFGSYTSGTTPKLYKILPDLSNFLTNCCDPTGLALDGPTGDLVFITSAAEKKVRSQEAFHISGCGVSGSETVTFDFGSAALNAKFTCLTETGGSISTESDGTIDTDFYIYYTPGAGDTSDGIDKSTSLIASVGGTYSANTTLSTKTIIGRHLPADFVIAGKKNGKWYALPATMESTDHPAPVEIAVDDANNPSTAYTIASNKYGLEGPAAGNISDGDGQYVKLTMHPLSDAPLFGQAPSNTGIGKSGTAVATNKLSAGWWWKLEQINTSITNPQDAKYTIYCANNTSSLSIKDNAGNPEWGLYASGVDELRLIPVNAIEFTESEVVAWGQEKLILEVALPVGATQARAKLGDGSWSANKSLATTTGTSVNGTATKYNYTLDFTDEIDFSEAASEGKMLVVELLNSGGTALKATSVLIPKIVAANRTIKKATDATKGPWNTEVHVLPGVTLTIDASGYSPADMTIAELNIYPGATVVAEKGSLKATTLVLRNGWDRLSATKKYDVARLFITSSTGSLQTATAYSDWYIDFDQYYPVAVPWIVTTSEMRYKNTTSAASVGVKMRYYDGASRASNVQNGVGESENWKVYDVDGKAYPATLTPGIGYAMTAKRPVGKAFSIVRMPLTIPSADWTAGGEQGNVSTTHKDQVSVTAHGDENTPVYAKGWNFIANPYMSLYQGALSYANSETVEYANIPDENFKEFDQQPILTTKFKPSSAFLIQAPTTGVATFATANRKASAPQRYSNEASESEMQIQRAYILLGDDQTEDMMGILVGEKYTADYELNADLEKLLSDGNTLRTYMRYNDMNMAYLAINEELAKQLIPVSVRIPADGEYTFRIHEASIADELEGIYLTDYQTNTVTNLLYDSYTFNAVAGTDNARFAINAVIGKREVPTGVDISGSDKDKPTKFIWNDKVYILHNNVIYDSTGKRVNVINK